jgi:predicted Zn finger-like uncharacterized protein
MSLITCCPACGTMFKVVADQLKISEGWVRCGHCEHVFDATAHMIDALHPAAPAPVPTQDERIEAPPPAPPERESAPEPESEPTLDVAPTSELPAESPLDQTFVFRRSDLAREASSDFESQPALAPDSAQPGELPPDEPAADVSFVRQARRRAFWRRPLVRAFLLLLVLVLGGALAAQVAIHDRNRIAAMQPQLRPALEQLCAYAGCTVGPPRQIEAIAIDSSTFNKLRSDTYRLSFTLKNSAATPVATPSMELTLTDTQDQPVLRRVLSPAELGASSATLGPGAEWSGSVALGVGAVGGGSGRIAGYRLLAFYP